MGSAKKGHKKGANEFSEIAIIDEEFEEVEEETWSVGQIIKQSSNKTTKSVSRWFCEERFLRLLKRRVSPNC